VFGSSLYSAGAQSLYVLTSAFGAVILALTIKSDFLKNKFSGHSTFVLSTIEVIMNVTCYQQLK